MSNRSPGLPRRLDTLAARAGGICALALPLAAAGAGSGSAAGGVGAAAPPRTGGPAATVMAGAERYCTGYEHTFHGVWTSEDEEGAPVLFRVGANGGAGGRGCYAQLNVMERRGIAPYELPRFHVETEDGGLRTLRYRTILLVLDTERRTAVHRQGDGPPRTGSLLERPPPVGNVPPAPPARRMERWYGRWRGRFAGLPFPVTLRFSGGAANEVNGRISALLWARSFTGRFHGEMLVFRWRNRHVGLILEEGGNSLVHVNYRGEAFRFHRQSR